MRRWFLCFCFLAFLVGNHASADDENVDWLLGVPSVQPSFRILPANFLKFYLTFPGPMARGEAFRHLALFEVREDGSEVEVVEPFREIELWDESGKRLTLWLHPGRQKPGVNLNEEFGPVLTKGSRYALVVSNEWKFETGDTLAASFRHEFSVGAADTSPPEPKVWKVEDVEDKFIKVRTMDTLDPVSLESRITLKGPDGQPIHVANIAGENWFMMAVPFSESHWKPGVYRIVVDPKLEDLAGNSVARPFNLDLEANPDFSEIIDPIEITFSIPDKP